MAIGQVKLSMAFEAKDKLIAVIEKTNQAMGKFSKNTQKASKTATSNFATIKGSISGVSTKFTEMKSKLDLVKAGFQAVQAAAEFAVRGEIAANADTVFTQIMGGAENASKAIKKLRAVSRGLTDETTLKQYTAGLSVAGVELKEIARMVRVAADVSLATGEDLTGMMEKIRVAAIEGSQGEFEKLGLTINVNEELKKRIEAEGRLLSDMTKNEQVTARMNILIDKLGTTMAAAGIDTKELSTSIGGLKSSLDNIVNDFERGFADIFNDNEAERVRNEIVGVFEALEDYNLWDESDVVGKLERTRGVIIKLAGDLKLSEEQVREVLMGPKGDRYTDFTFNAMSAARAFTPVIIRERQKQRRAEQKNAKDRMTEAVDEQKNKAKQSKDILKENRDLSLKIMDLGSKKQAVEKSQIKRKIEMNKLALELLNGMALDEYNYKVSLVNKTAEIEKATGEKEAADRRKERAKAAKERIKAARETIVQESEKSNQEARARLLNSTKSAQVRRDLELSFFQDDKDIKIRHGLELEDLEKRKNTTLNQLDASSEEERQLERDRFMAEEVTLARTHGEELAAVQKALSEKKFEEQQSEAERAAEALKKQREIFQEEMSEIAQATSLIEAPLTQLVDHQKGASDQMKALGGAALATSSAMNVYANETDASASASSRFKQGLPAMTHAGGIAAASFVKNTKNKALVQGGFEAASSLAAFATGNIPGGIGHAAAASMFFALAGKSGGGKKGGQQATTTGALTAGGGGSSGLSATGGSGAIVVNVQGFALGSAREMGAKMAQTIDQARETGLDSSEV